MKKTEWFDGSKFVPAHVGVYERDYSFARNGSIVVYSKWNGKVWMSADENISAASFQERESPFQNDPWRGMAEKP